MSHHSASAGLLVPRVGAVPIGRSLVALGLAVALTACGWHEPPRSPPARPWPVPSVAPAWMVAPSDAAVTRHFEPPAHPFGPGHRGIDFGAAVGAPVRAAGSGTVAFAGQVAGRLAISIRHRDALVTTYSDLGAVAVAVGEVVESHDLIGTAAGAFHFGVLRHGHYLDPIPLLEPSGARLVATDRERD